MPFFQQCGWLLHFSEYLAIKNCNSTIHTILSPNRGHSSEADQKKTYVSSREQSKGRDITPTLSPASALLSTALMEKVAGVRCQAGPTSTVGGHAMQPEEGILGSH